jgi:hypothetical protein
MRGLAEYAMTGRRQAVTVAILLGLIPLLGILSGAVVALVTMRKGVQEGFLVLLWALLPAGLQWVMGDTSPVLMLFAVLFLGALLRKTESWPLLLVAASVIGILLQLSLLLQTDYVSRVRELLGGMMDQGMTLQLPENGEMVQASPEDAVNLMLQFYGLYHSMLFITAVIIGRFWQAMLYNPGGFRQEFHNLRIPPRLMGGLLVLVIAGLAGLQPLANWLPMLCIVPLFNALAAVHAIVAARKLGSAVLVMAYMVLLFMAPLIVAMGFLDSVVNFRARLIRKENN